MTRLGVFVATQLKKMSKWVHLPKGRIGNPAHESSIIDHPPLFGPSIQRCPVVGGWATPLKNANQLGNDFNCLGYIFSWNCHSMHNSNLILSSLWTKVLEYFLCLESYYRQFRISKPQKVSCFKFNHLTAGKWHVIIMSYPTSTKTSLMSVKTLVVIYTSVILLC